MISEPPQILQQSKSNRLLKRQAVHIFSIILACACLFIVVYPSSGFAQKVSTTIIFAQLLAFPLLLGFGILACSTAFLILRKVKSGTFLAMGSCVLWIVVALALIIFPHGLPAEQALTSDKKPQQTLSIVTFNTGASLTPAGFQELIRSFNPDVIILPETGVSEVNQALKTTSYAGIVFETPNTGFTSTYNGLIAPTTVVVNKRLGSAKLTTEPATSYGTVAIEFADPQLPTIIGIHAAPPLPSLMHAWKDDLERVIKFGETSTKPMLIAGDFNATLRHGALAARSRLTDAQEFCSAWHMGTWNSHFPAFAQTPIDHILITPELEASSCKTMRIGHSDHLAFGTKIAIF